MNTLQIETIKQIQILVDKIHTPCPTSHKMAGNPEHAEQILKSTEEQWKEDIETVMALKRWTRALGNSIE